MADTIAAIASGMTNSGIGIIRMSGPDAVKIGDAVFVPKNKKLSESETHTVHFGTIVDENKNVIDEVLVLLMKGPKSYTTEDVVEIDCHGGVVVLQKILEAVLRAGARPAEPGEFTKRAFLGGRIDLAQAESVMGVISAENENALSASVNNLKGSLSNEIKSLREDILYENAFIESALDDPEHISLDGYPEKLKGKVDEILGRLGSLIDSFHDGELIREGINTVLVGKPNAGKSSVWNTFLGKEKAIVTDIAGTTRDALEEKVNLNGILLKIVDTAGIRQTGDVVEKIGVDKSISYIDQADLVLYVVDSSVPLDENDFDIIEKIRDRQVIIILNKSDLEAVTDVENISSRLDKPVVSFSSVDGSGLDELKNVISDMFFKGNISFNEQVYITNIRQKNNCEMAASSLRNVLTSIENGMPEDFFSIDLIDAYTNLGFVIGESVEDDLVDKIFREFCTGK